MRRSLTTAAEVHKYRGSPIHHLQPTIRRRCADPMFKMSVRPSCGRHITTSEVALLLLWSRSHRHNSPHAPNALGPPSLPAAPILSPNTYETKLIVIPGTVPGSDGSREPRVVRSWMYCHGARAIMMLARRCGGQWASCPALPHSLPAMIPPAAPTASHNRAVVGMERASSLSSAVGEAVGAI